jgi:hypothetical protein
MTAFLNLDHAVNEDNRQHNARAMGFLHGLRMLYARTGPTTIGRDYELAVIRSLWPINPVWPPMTDDGRQYVRWGDRWGIGRWIHPDDVITEQQPGVFCDNCGLPSPTRHTPDGRFCDTACDDAWNLR